MLCSIKFVLSGTERRKRRVGVPCSLAITHVSKNQKRRTISPGNGGGSPFCQRGLRRQNDESQNVMLRVWNSTTVHKTEERQIPEKNRWNKTCSILRRLTVNTRIKLLKYTSANLTIAHTYHVNSSVIPNQRNEENIYRHFMWARQII